MTVAGSYDDNFFRSETNKTSVWSAIYTPGVEAEYLTDRSRFDLNYSMPYFQYFGTRAPIGQSPALDVSSLDYLGQNLSMYAAEKVCTRLLVGVQETYLLTNEPGLTDNFSQLVTRDRYWVNRVSPFIGYDIAEKGEIKFAYRNEDLEWIEAPNQPNSTENRGTVTGTYNLNTTNHLDLVGEFWHRDYTASNPAFLEADYDAYQAQLVYRRELNSWLTAHAGGGYQWREFDNSEAAPNINTPVYSIGVAGATDRSKLDLSFEHGLVDFTIGNSYFTAYRVNATGQYLFCDVLRAYGGAYWQLSQYVDQTRQDNTYNIFVGLGYSFWNKRMEVSAEYNHTNNDSNTSGLNYADNIVFLRLSAKYDFPKK